MLLSKYIYVHVHVHCVITWYFKLRVSFDSILIQFAFCILLHKLKVRLFFLTILWFKEKVGLDF